MMAGRFGLDDARFTRRSKCRSKLEELSRRSQGKDKDDEIGRRADRPARPVHRACNGLSDAAPT